MCTLVVDRRVRANDQGFVACRWLGPAFPASPVNFYAVWCLLEMMISEDGFDTADADCLWEFCTVNRVGQRGE